MVQQIDFVKIQAHLIRCNPIKKMQMTSTLTTVASYKNKKVFRFGCTALTFAINVD